MMKKENKKQRSKKTSIVLDGVDVDDVESGWREHGGVGVRN